MSSLIFSHFLHTSAVQLAFTSAIFYTIGNYHMKAYGCTHFAKIFGLSALGASALLLNATRSGDMSTYHAGAMGPAAGLIAYNVFRNP